jgi:hypothetical protein
MLRIASKMSSEFAHDEDSQVNMGRLSDIWLYSIFDAPIIDTLC